MSQLPMSAVQRISPSALAYLGDAVYELYIRQAFVFPPQRIQNYHQTVVSWVRAEAQAQQLDRLFPHLTEPELAIVKRGRNAAPQRLKRVNPEIYQKATALETLIGYLHLTDPARLVLLLSTLSLDGSADESPEGSPEGSSNALSDESTNGASVHQSLCNT